MLLGKVPYSTDLFYLMVKFYKMVLKLRFLKLKTNFTVQRICECQATIICNEIYLGMLLGNVIMLLNYWLLYGDFHRELKLLAVFNQTIYFSLIQLLIIPT